MRKIFVHYEKNVCGLHRCPNSKIFNILQNTFSKKIKLIRALPLLEPEYGIN